MTTYFTYFNKLLTNSFCDCVGNFIFLGCTFALSKTNGSRMLETYRASQMFSVTFDIEDDLSNDINHIP